MKNIVPVFFGISAFLLLSFSFSHVSLAAEIQQDITAEDIVTGEEAESAEERRNDSGDDSNSPDSDTVSGNSPADESQGGQGSGDSSAPKLYKGKKWKDLSQEEQSSMTGADRRLISTMVNYADSLGGYFNGIYKRDGAVKATQCCAYVNQVWFDLFGTDLYYDHDKIFSSSGETSKEFFDRVQAAPGDVIYTRYFDVDRKIWSQHYYILLSYDDEGVYITDGYQNNQGKYAVWRINEKLPYGHDYLQNHGDHVDSDGTLYNSGNGSGGSYFCIHKLPQKYRNIFVKAELKYDIVSEDSQDASDASDAADSPKKEKSTNKKNKKRTSNASSSDASNETDGGDISLNEDSGSLAASLVPRKIRISDNGNEAVEGSIVYPTVTVYPRGAEADISWEVVKGSSVIVDENGELYCAAPGKTTVKAYCTDDPDIRDTLNITVLPKVRSIYLKSSSLRLSPGETVRMDYRVEPEGLSGDMIWISSDPLTVFVDNGLISAAKNSALTEEYTVTVTAMDKNGASASCEVTVIPNAVSDDEGAPIPVPGADDIWISGFSEYLEYDGSKLTQDIKVYHGTKLLTEGEDYRVRYKNNILPAFSDSDAPPTMTVELKGNYKGRIIRNFEIRKYDISHPEEIVITRTFNGQSLMLPPEINVNLKGQNRTLKEGRDFVAVYEDGDYTSVTTSPLTIKISGRGNYWGSRIYKLYITEDLDLSAGSISRIPDYRYTGESIFPHLSGGMQVEFNGELLSPDKYQVSYTDNVSVGRAHVVVTAAEGSGFHGSLEADFNIVPMGDISEAKLNADTWVKTLSAAEGYMSADGTGLIQDPDAALLVLDMGEGSVPLEPVYYDIAYKNNDRPGTATAIFTGKNGVTGSFSAKFRVRAASLNEGIENGLINVSVEDVPFTKGGSRSPVELSFAGNALDHNLDYFLREGRDYTVTYRNFLSVGEASSESRRPTASIRGRGLYKGSMDVYYSIFRQDISELKMEISDIGSGRTVKPVFSIIDENGRKLKAGADFSRNYIISSVSGEASEEGTEKLKPGDVVSVTVFGEGNYSGSITGYFKIMGKDIADATVRIRRQYYTSQPVELKSADMQLTVDGKTLPSKYYEITGYSNNTETGVATVYLEGRGIFGGKKQAKFRIVSKTSHE